MRRPRPLWIALGLALGIAIALLVFVREPGGPLDAAGLEQARERWSRRAPASYTLELETGGSMPALHRVTVEGGEVVAMTTGGAEAAPSAWEYWSVEGLFGFLETELANAGRPAAPYGVGAGEVVLRVRFHPEWGYPEFFLRHVMGKRLGVEWRVTSFEPGPAP